MVHLYKNADAWSTQNGIIINNSKIQEQLVIIGLEQVRLNNEHRPKGTHNRKLETKPLVITRWQVVKLI